MIQGIVFTDTWGDRKEIGDTIDNPIDIIEYCIRQSGGTVLTGNVAGSFDHSSLDPVRNIQVAREILEAEQSNTDEIIKSLCKEFFLIHYQNGSGVNCLEYIFKTTDPVLTFYFDDCLSISEIAYPARDNIYFEPYVKYSYDHATEKYLESIQILNIAAASWQAEYTPGFTNSAMWDSIKTYYNRYGFVNPMPADVGESKWIINKADAIDRMTRVLSLSLRNRISITVAFSYFNTCLPGTKIWLYLKHETNDTGVPCIIEKTTINKSNAVIKLDLIMLG